jgi:phage shock protein A
METTETTETTTETTTDATPQNPRNTPAFEAMRKQIVELRDKLSSYEAREAETAKEAEMRRVEEVGAFRETVARLEAERAAERQAHTSELLRHELRYTLTREGMVDELAIAGAVAGYDPGVAVGDYVTTLKARHSAAFEPRVTPAHAAPQGARAGVPAHNNEPRNLREVMAHTLNALRTGDTR